MNTGGEVWDKHEVLIFNLIVAMWLYLSDRTEVLLLHNIYC